MTELQIVEIEWTTDWDGRPIGPDERYARTFHGPFADEAEATAWVEDFPDFPELAEMTVICLNPVQGRTRAQNARLAVEMSRIAALLREDQKHLPEGL